MKALVSLFLLLITISSVAALPENFQQELYAQGASQPTAMQFAPDGRLFIAEKLPSCQLSIIDNGEFLQTPFYSMSYLECNNDWEMGLLGVAFDPDFENNGYVYMYHTRNTNPITHRVIRVTQDPQNPNQALAGSEVVILDNIPGEAGNHNGGAIHFGLDGTLYIAVGDGGATPQNGQRTDTLMGKLLRINPDGTIPSDNPFVGNGAYSQEIYALGLRNPFTFAIDPATDRIHVNDVGGGDWEEINDIIPGGNYGWPQCEGACSNPDFENPRFAYPHWGGSGPNGFAITGGTFYRGSTFPAEYNGAYFFSDYTQTWIYVLMPDDSVQEFSTTSNNPIDLKVGPDGALYFANFNTGEVRRIQYYGAQTNTPPVAAALATPTQGLAPLTVTLSAAASSDQNNDPLTYTWNPGDGTGNQTGVTLEHTYQTSGQYAATVWVCDAEVCDTATTSVIVGALPQPTILSPSPSDLYTAGQAVSYQGSAVDSQGNTISSENLSWTFVLHHDEHTHPFLGPVTGASGSITPTPSGHTEHTVWYRFILEATDAYGFSNSTFVDVHPNKANLTFVTDPPGLMFELEGQPRQAPYEVRSVTGITRTVNAPSPQNSSGTEYVFDSWSHSAQQENSFASPATDTTYTATFTAVENPVPVLLGDRNSDGVVNVQDILIIINHFGRTVATYPQAEVADINSDGVINVFDLVLVAREFGQTNLTNPPSSDPYANMPQGWGILNEYGWEDIVPNGAEVPISSGWSSFANPDGYMQRATDNTDPISAPYVLEWQFPVGRPSGYGVGGAFRILSEPLDQVYISFPLWHDENFEFHPISNKLIFLWPGPQTLLQSYHGSGYFEMNVNGISYPPNIVPDYEIPRGEWINVEYLVDSVNNRVQIWVDGVLISDQTISLGGDWNELTIDSTWGGGGTDGIRESYRRMGHILIATPSGSSITPDTTSPSQVTGLSASASSSSTVSLSWNAASDNVGVSQYHVERCQGVSCSNFVEVATPSITSHGDSSLSASTTYRYRVRARDAAGNNGAYSSVVSVTTPASTPVVNGVCGSRATSYSSSTSSWPGGSTYCSSGTADSNPNFPAEGSSVNWNCVGSGGGSTASCTATRESGVEPPADILEFSNMPSGMSIRTDTEWVSGVPSGWNLGNRDGTASVVSDATSPTGGALELHYPAGLASGADPGVAYIGAGPAYGAEEMFMGVVMRYSENWVPNLNQVKLHLWFVENANTGSQLQWFGMFDGCGSGIAGQWTMASWGSQPIAYPNKIGDCWVNDAPFADHTPGDWVKQELYARKSTPGQSDGVISIWIDDVLVLNATNLVFPESFRWGEFQHVGTYGGGGSAVPNDQQLYVAKTLLAYR